MNTEFGRLITAMVTPFNAQGDVDYTEAIRLAAHLRDTGSNAIVLAGTTGESPTLTHEEEHQLFKTVKKALGHSIKLIAGAGSNCTKTAIESTQFAQEIGMDGVLQVVPYYNKPSQAGILAHFTHIAKSTTLPILLYNIPSRTGVNMEPETVAALSKFSNVFGVKESSGRVDQVQKILKLSTKGFIVYSGDDATTLNFMEAGAYGVVSVAAHFVGVKITKMISLFLKHKDTDAREIEDDLKPLFKALFITSNPSPTKAGLRKLGFNVGIPRLPLVDVTDKERNEVESSLKALGIL